MEEKKIQRRIHPEKELRKTKILEWIKEGKSKSTILTSIKTEFNVGRTQSYRLFHSVLLDISSTVDIDISETKSLYIERIEGMLEKALNSGDIKTALRCQDQLNKIQGLYTEKQELTVTNDIIKFNFDS